MLLLPKSKAALSKMFALIQVFLFISVINAQPYKAFEWEKRGEDLQNKASYDSAIVAYKKAVRLYTSLDSLTRVVSCLNQIGRIYQFKKDYDNSLPYLEEALILGKDNLLSSHPQLALAHNFLGISFRNLYQFKRSLSHYQKALEIRKKHFGNDHLLVANVLGNIGSLFRIWGDYDTSIKYYLKAIKIIPKDSKLELAKRFLNIGVAYLGKGDYLTAENYFQKILTILDENNQKHSRIIQKAYFNIGLTFSKKFDEITALLYYQNALTHFQNDLEGKVLILNNMAALYNELGKYNEAIECCQNAINIQKIANPKNYQILEKLYNNLGFSYVLKKEWERALPFYNKALEYIDLIGSKDNKQFMPLFNGLSIAYTNLNKHEQAVGSIKESLQIGLKLFGPRSPVLFETYINYGNIYFSEKKYTRALDYYQKAISTTSENYDENDVLTLPTIKNVLLESELLIAISAKVRIFVSIANYEVLNNSNARTQYLEAIISHYDIAYQLTHNIRTGFKSEGSKFLLAKEVLKILDISLDAAQELYELTGDETYLAKIFEMGELGKSMALADALAESRARTFGQLPDSLLERESALKIDLVALENRIEKLQSNEALRDSSLIDSLNGRYGKLQITYNELLESFEKKYPEYYNLKYSNTLPKLADVQASLGDDEAMLEYFLGEKDVRLFLISQNNFETHKFPNDSIFQELLSSFNRSIRKVSEAGSFAERSAALYDKLIRPIASKIADKKKLVIIPDGELYYLPFEALIKEMPANTQDFASMAYLVKDVEVSYHYSANLYLHSLEKEVAETKYNVAGFAPVFQDGDDGSEILESGSPVLGQIVDYLKDITRDGQQFNELPHSENEAREIVNLFDWETQKSYGYFRGEATEERFKQDAHQFKYLHLATHSFVNEERPQLSGIAFSQPEDTSAVEDGILYSGEIYNLDLNADLVVLSSCESGLGKLIRGEGLMAMTRGFLYAGATNVLVSLWAVYDRHTSDLMTEFYRQIDDAKSYAPALRAAKLKMIENRDTAFPALWSSFVLIGR